MKMIRAWLHSSPLKVVLFLTGWLSISLSLYWFIFQPRAAVSRISMGISLLAGLLLIVLARHFFNHPSVEQWNLRERVGWGLPHC